MNLSAKPRRVIRAAPEHHEVFVLGETTRDVVVAPAIATMEQMLSSAAHQGALVLAEAEDEAETILSRARASAASVRDEAYTAGYEAGKVQALQEMSALVDLARHAAAEAKVIRDEVAGQSAGVVARATTLAVRRIVAEYYEADPGRTAAVCAEALRAAAGQEILSIRVSPGLVAHVQATLVDASQYVIPDGAVEVGGCIIDLRHGTLDATLDARLTLMEFALAEAGGAGQP